MESIKYIMNNLLKLGKKIFTVGVASTTIFWSLGVAALVPAVATAATQVDCATVVAGDFVKANGADIWVVNADKTKSYFPHGDTFKSWTADSKYTFKWVTGDCLASFPASGIVAPRPGAYLLKDSATDKMYVTLADGKLAEISADAAKGVFGASYAALPAKGGRTIPAASADMVLYTKNFSSTKVTEAVPTEGSLVSNGGKYYVVGASKALREVSATGLTANKFQTKFAVALASTSGYSMSAVVDAMDAALSDATFGFKAAPGTVVTPPVVAVGGSLMVSLAADTPAAHNIADTTAYNNVLKVNLTADKTTKVTGITLTKTGLLSNSYVTGVSVWDSKGNRHGDVMTSLTSDNKVTVGFGSNPVLVAAGAPETLTVAVNIGSSGSGLVGFKVAASTDVATDGTVGGTFPVEGNQLSLISSSGTIGAFTVTSGTVSGITDGSQTTASNANVQVGDKQKEIAKTIFTENSSGAVEDISVQTVTYYFEGSLKDKDLNNLKVYAPDNTVLGSADAIVDRYVTVKFDKPYTIGKGTNKTLTLKADIVDGSGDYFRVHVQNSYDVMVKGVSTGYYLNPTSFIDTKETNGWFRMKAGNLTINKNPSSPAGNVTVGSQNVVLGSFDVQAVGENMELRKVGLTVTKAGSGQKNLTGNVAVRDAKTGTVYVTVAATDSNVYSGYQYNLSNYINIKSGETKTLEVVGSIDSTATSGNIYQAKIGNFYGKRLSSLDYNDNMPSSSNAGTSANQLTSNTTALTCTKDTAMGSVTRSTGATQVIAQFICTAGTAEDVTLSNVSLTFNYVSGAGNANANYQNLSLWDGSTQLGATINSVASSSNSFSFSLPIAKNVTKVIQVKAYVQTAASGVLSTSLASDTYTGTSSGNSTTNTDNPTGQSVTVGDGSLTVAAVSDATTLDKIYGPGATGVQLGKWKFSASNDSLNLNKVTLTARYANNSTASTLGTFGGFTLYDGTNPVGTASYVSGDVVFNGLNVTIPMDDYKVLTLKGNVNASGVLTNATTTLFAFKSDSNTDMEVRSSAGALLAVGSINGSGANTFMASSSRAIFHDAYPVISAGSISATNQLALDSKAQIFKFTINNLGTRDLGVSSTLISVNVSGLAANGSATGTIGTWKLYEDNGSGGLGTYLAATTTTGLAGGASVANYLNQSSITLLFDQSSDQNSLFDSLLVAPGSSRTFIVVADTTNIFAGKTQGVVTVSAKISGSTGWDGSSAWSTGNASFYYTPVGGSVQGPYSHSDSYDVSGNALSRSI